jgi:DNA polymerase elongation subunit (family B)
MFGEHKTLTNEKIFKVINIKIESNLRIFIISKHKKRFVYLDTCS